MPNSTTIEPVSSAPLSADWTPERIVDRLQITEVLHRYCRAIDRIQPQDLAKSVFHPDATIDKTGDPIPVADFIAYVGERHPGVPRSSHMTVTPIIEFTGPDSAFVESWCLALERHVPTADEPRTIDRVVRVRYGDRFERRAGLWRSAARTFVLDHMLSVPYDPALEPAGFALLQGLRSNDDPLMQLRAAAGVR